MSRFYIPDVHFLPADRVDETQKEKVSSEHQRKKSAKISGRGHRKIGVASSSIIFAG